MHEQAIATKVGHQVCCDFKSVIGIGLNVAVAILIFLGIRVGIDWLFDNYPTPTAAVSVPLFRSLAMSGLV